MVLKIRTRAVPYLKEEQGQEMAMGTTDTMPACPANPRRAKSVWFVFSFPLHYQYFTAEGRQGFENQFSFWQSLSFYPRSKEVDPNPCSAGFPQL